jgi:hypothetical protein
MKTKHDWSRPNAMTEEQRHAAGLADPHAQPLTDPNKSLGEGRNALLETDSAAIIENANARFTQRDAPMLGCQPIADGSGARRTSGRLNP